MLSFKSIEQKLFELELNPKFSLEQWNNKLYRENCIWMIYNETSAVFSWSFIVATSKNET